jgi:hypothetical protein
LDLRTFTAVLAGAIAMAGCSDTIAPDISGPPVPLDATSIIADPDLADAAEVAFTATASDLVRAHYASTDSSDVGVTPWFQGGTGRITVLGLLPTTTYDIALEASRNGTAVTGNTSSYKTPSLPQDLRGVSLTLISGSAPTSGYTLISLTAPGGHGYLVAFDHSGTIRWFRDFGDINVQEAKQQTNGNFTVFVGNSIGVDPTAGAFVELTPAGDSVRAITAKGSPYTDGHELLVVSDAQGKRLADYLYGYDIRNIDETAYGGGPDDPVAGHQLLRINANGVVDTLMQGWDYWVHDDRIDPPVADQAIDHPNSITFDLNGNIIASFRNTGAILKLDTTTHNILWQLGGARNQFTFIDDPFNGFGGQHSVRVLPNGNFLVFDNGVTHTPQTSRVVEYALDQTAKTATMVWEYVPSAPLFNQFTGSVQQLTNGNTVVGWTNYGWVDEVAPDGSLVNRMELDSSPGVRNMSAYRAIRIDNLYSYKVP